LATGSANETRLEAIVLAAGSGSRFGGGKLLAPWRGGVLLDGALAAAFAAPVRTVTVVTGAGADRVAAAARAFAETAGQTGRLRLVHAPDHAEGMAATLRTGIAALPADTEAAFVFLGDMPAIPHAILPRLAEALAGADAAAPEFEGRRGHPVLIGAALFPALSALKGDEGARKVLAGLGDRLALVEAPDDGVLFDVDRPEDLPG
jgi:molybdenum cofactor cytidylyltransferase